MYVAEIHWSNTDRIDTIPLENIDKIKQYEQMLNNSYVEKVNIYIPITKVFHVDDNFTDNIIKQVKELETENNLKYRKELLKKARRY